MKQSRKDQFGGWRCLEKRVGEEEASTGIVRHQEGFVPGWMGGMGASSEAELTTWPVKLADPERSRKEDKKYTEQRESMCWVIHSQSKAASFPECLEFLKGKSPPIAPTLIKHLAMPLGSAVPVISLDLFIITLLKPPQPLHQPCTVDSSKNGRPQQKQILRTFKNEIICFVHLNCNSHFSLQCAFFKVGYRKTLT